MSNNNFVVMVNYDAVENSRDIRCRGDIERHPHFQRCGSTVTYYGPDSIRPKIYYVLYDGHKKQAQRFAETLKLMYQGLANTNANYLQ